MLVRPISLSSRIIHLEISVMNSRKNSKAKNTLINQTYSRNGEGCKITVGSSVQALSYLRHCSKDTDVLQEEMCQPMRLTHTLSKRNLTLLKLLSQVSLSLPNNNYKMSGSPPDKQPHVLNPSVIWQLWPGLSRGDSRLSLCSLISFTTLGKPPHLQLSPLLHLGKKNLCLFF